MVEMIIPGMISVSLLPGEDQAAPAASPARKTLENGPPTRISPQRRDLGPRNQEIRRRSRRGRAAGAVAGAAGTEGTAAAVAAMIIAGEIRGRGTTPASVGNAGGGGAADVRSPLRLPRSLRRSRRTTTGGSWSTAWTSPMDRSTAAAAANRGGPSDGGRLELTR